MKKFLSFVFALVFTLSIVPGAAFAASSDLILNIQIRNLQTSDNPLPIEVTFDLAEPIDLSQGESDIIYEFLTTNTGGSLESLNYIKDKTWGGYLNSYSNYPDGRAMYSNGEHNEGYPDLVPATKIYTTTKSSASIDLTKVTAVAVTVFRADGSGQKVIIALDGSILSNETIYSTTTQTDDATGVSFDAPAGVIPAGTIMVVEPVTDAASQEKIATVLALVTSSDQFVSYEITLLSNDLVTIQPNGKIKIRLPVPDDFDTENLIVYRIDLTDNSKTAYDVTPEIIDGVLYATFETDHFSTYVLTNDVAPLAGEEPGEKSPKTGSADLSILFAFAALALLTGSIVILRKNSARQ